MKRIAIIIIALIYAIAAYGQGGIRIEQDTRHIKLTVWSNTNHYGTAKVYYGGRYMGTITSFYDSDPGVGASGCVTFDYTVGPYSSVVRIESDYGYIWHHEADIRYVGDTGGTLRVFCRGEKDKERESTRVGSDSSGSSEDDGSESSSYSSSSRYQNYDYGETIMDRVGRSAMSQSRIAMSGYPNLQLGLQISTFFGESLTTKIELGGMGGVALVGGIGKDFIQGGTFTDGHYGWFAGIGYYSGDEENDFDLLVGYGIQQFDISSMFWGTLEYTRFVTPRFGLLAGLSLGIADTGFKFEAHAGITYKILMH